MTIALRVAQAVCMLVQAVVLVMYVLLRLPGKKRLLRIGFEAAVLVLLLGADYFISEFFLKMAVVFVMWIWILRDIRQIVLCGKELRTSISAISIKEGMDALPAGLLFFAQDGRVMLINRRMQELLREIGESHVFSQTGNRVHEAGGRMWMFARSKMLIGKKWYTQLTAADVTEQWSLTEELRAKKVQLEQRGLELSAALNELDAVCRAEEALWLRTRVHDVLGQRVTLLLRALREQTPPDTQLSAFANDLPQLLRENRDTEAAARRLQRLQELMREIGVTLSVRGELPDCPETADLIADIVMECSTNAVRHGFAAEIDVRLGQGVLTVANNGRLPERALVPGHGISGMQKKLAAAGGRLTIQTTAPFTVTAEFPGVK